MELMNLHKMNKNSIIELKHIRLELENNRYQHLRHFIDQYYCYMNGYANRNGKADWEKIVWGVNETISVNAYATRNRKEVVKEHVIPLKRIITELKQLSLIKNQELETIKSCIDGLLLFATITKEEDRRLRELKLTSSMPKEYDDPKHDLYLNPYSRYVIARIELAQLSKQSSTPPRLI